MYVHLINIGMKCDTFCQILFKDVVNLKTDHEINEKKTFKVDRQFAYDLS